MTNDERLGKLAAVAAQIAVEAPLNFNGYGATTLVKRQHINAIRDLLDGLGISWKEHAEEYQRIVSERQSG